MGAEQPAREATRMGGVWGSDFRKDGSSTHRQSTDTGASAYSSISPLRTKCVESNTKRREAAEWIKQLSGIDVPYSSDNYFRAALKDGVILCRILNSVVPGHVPKVIDSNQVEGRHIGSQVQSIENVQNFLQGVQQLRVPTDCIFSLSDLESDGWEDRPRIVDCLLWLKRLYEHVDTVPSPGPLRYTAAGRLSDQNYPTPDPIQHRALYGSLPTLTQLAPEQHQQMVAAAAPMAIPQQQQLQQQQAMAIQQPFLSQSMTQQQQHYDTSVGLAHSASMQSAAASTLAGVGPPGSRGFPDSAGITKLMQTCTVMLRDRMSAFSMQVDVNHTHAAAVHQQQALTMPAFDAVGPVLESVLGGLTQEYERRLLAKDHEISDTKGKMDSVNRAMVQLQGQLDGIKADLEDKQRLAVENVAAASGEAIATLRDEKAAMQQLLADNAEYYGQLQSKLDSVSVNQDERSQQLEDQLGEMQDQLGEAHDKLQSMARIEADNRTMQEENKLLYNLVQDLKGSIRVFCRVRPLGRTGDSASGCMCLSVDGELAILDKAGGRPQVFKYDRVFGEDSTQEEIYSDTQPLIRSVLDGYNVCIFAYGQTGSGKTHTMSGTQVEDMEGRGINYRALDDLFDLNEQRKNKVQYTIKVQMLEIYNETLRDLLSPDQSRDNRLDILSTQSSGSNVPGATQVIVSNTADVMRMMRQGSKNRHSAETKMNQRSSRSHQVLTVIVLGMNVLTGARSHGCLHLVDLAGSERPGKSEAVGDRLTEANHINTSLSALGNVMQGLANKAGHVPFRNSKLTLLLQDSLSGQAKVMMFMHVAPEASSSAESVGTLKFGARVSEITLGQAKKNQESGEVYKAQEALARVQATAQDKEAALHGALERERSEKDLLLRQLDELKAQVYSQSLRSSIESAASLYSTASQPRIASQQAGAAGALTARRRASIGGPETHSSSNSVASSQRYPPSLPLVPLTASSLKVQQSTPNPRYAPQQAATTPTAVVPLPFGPAPRPAPSPPSPRPTPSSSAAGYEPKTPRSMQARLSATAPTSTPTPAQLQSTPEAASRSGAQHQLRAAMQDALHHTTSHNPGSSAKTPRRSMATAAYGSGLKDQSLMMSSPRSSLQRSSPPVFSAGGASGGLNSSSGPVIKTTKANEKRLQKLAQDKAEAEAKLGAFTAFRARPAPSTAPAPASGSLTSRGDLGRNRTPAASSGMALSSRVPGMFSAASTTASLFQVDSKAKVPPSTVGAAPARAASARDGASTLGARNAGRGVWGA
ncbi:MAG: hypothetical protein WDW36_002299 [Sanguina aurantia]